MYKIVSNKISARSQAWEQLERAVQVMVLVDDTWACRAALALFEEQTPVEQETDATTENNERGLSKTDAEFFSSVAKRLLDKQDVSWSQLRVIRQRTLKYRRQLAKMLVAKKGPEYARNLIDKVVTLGIL